MKISASARFVDRLRLLGGLVTLLWLPISPLSAQSRSAPEPGVEATAQRERGIPHRVPGTGLSANWSGYAVHGSSFTDVSGSWYVPAVSCSLQPDSYSDFWVGIDGLSGAHPEQVGTSSDCEKGIQYYYAWSQLTAGTNVLCFSVNVGDLITAQVSYSSSTKGFTSTITDVSQPSLPPCVVGPKKVKSANRDSAEWIVEKPKKDLADFTEYGFGFSNGYAADAKKSGSIGAFPGVDPITMYYNNNLARAVPSGLVGGSSFSVGGATYTFEATGSMDDGSSLAGSFVVNEISGLITNPIFVLGPPDSLGMGYPLYDGEDAGNGVTDWFLEMGVTNDIVPRLDVFFPTKNLLGYPGGPLCSDAYMARCGYESSLDLGSTGSFLQSGAAAAQSQCCETHLATNPE